MSEQKRDSGLTEQNKKTGKNGISRLMHSPGHVYLILVIIFTLILIADVILMAAVPANGRTNPGQMERPDAGSFSDMIGNGDFDPSEIIGDGDFDFSDGFGNGDFDPSEIIGNGDFDPSEIIENGDFDPSEIMGNGNLGPGGSFGNGNGDFDPSEILGDGDFDFSEIGGFGQEMTGRSNGNRFLQSIRRFAVPILILCVLGDVICLILFVRKRRKGTQGEESDEETDEEVQDEAAEKRIRGRRRNLIILAVFVIVVLLLILFFFAANRTGRQDTVTVDEEVLTGEAEEADIKTVLKGAGTLTEEEALEIQIPAAVTVKSYLVSDGDMVSAGDSIAEVDVNSVELAIAELQDVIDELDGQLAVVIEEEENDAIYASAGGRVKEIYAQEGVSAADTVCDAGALLVLSLDGQMSVKIETDAVLSVDESVNVHLEDGTELEGRVAAISKREGTTTVTISDENGFSGETAVVYSKEGEFLGSGELSISNALKVTGYDGTISSVEVEEGDEVTAGDLLFTLEDTGHSSSYTALMSRRGELTDQMEELVALKRDGILTADFDGIIAGISGDSAAETKEDEPEEEEENSTEGSPEEEEEKEEEQEEESLEEEQEEEEEARENFGTVTWLSSIIFYDEEPEEEESEEDPDASGNTESGQTESPSGEEDETTETEPAEETGTEDTGTEETEESTKADTSETTETESEGKTEETDSETAAEETKETEKAEETEAEKTEDQKKTEETVKENSGKSFEQAEQEVTIPESESGFSYDGMEGVTGYGNRDFSDFYGSMTSGFGFDFSGSVPEGLSDDDLLAYYSDEALLTEEETYAYETYNIEEKQIASIIPQETMTIEIEVDELDILSVSIGDEAAVTVDALTGRSFSGVITEISEASVSSGNTKYTVEVMIERNEQMIDGMNASVTLVTDTKHCACTVPSAALYDEGGKTVVYTSYDEKNDELGNPVEVITGTADGTTAEIVEGLSASDAYYYRYAGTMTYSFLNGSAE